MFWWAAPNRNFNMGFPCKQKNRKLAFYILITEWFSICKIVQEEQANLNTFNIWKEEPLGAYLLLLISLFLVKDLLGNLIHHSSRYE